MRSYFLGAGIHTALGDGVDANIRALQQLTLSPSAQNPSLPAPSMLSVRFAEQSIDVPYRVLANAVLDDNERRLYDVLEAVIESAIASAALSERDVRNMGLFFGSSSFDISASEISYQRDLRGQPDSAHPLATSSSLGNVAMQLLQRFGIRGPDFSFNTACTASANALMYADAMLRAGQIDHALVIGVELFNTVTAAGFHGLELLSADSMKPFDRARDGLTLGEGCSALILGARPRSDKDFYLRGAANLCDRHSITATDPNGNTIATVMRQALASAGLRPEAIRALKVHGTASLLNDEAEAAGMQQVFARLPPLCALKPLIGHTLGACGLNELILFCEAARMGFLIGTPGICANESDLGIALNQYPTPLSTGNFMLNYFGFGGNNTSLIVTNGADN